MRINSVLHVNSNSAVDQNGEGERAHRVAYGALKHTHEKVGDPWERMEGGRKQLDIDGRSRMSKPELLDAIRRANRSRTRESRTS
ncbi:ChaB family protein [Streptomyces bobili]|uniref:ChaB family protein n=1 Tax=Streptomyces bobili TaxID=67280 RepID=UPI0036FA1107